MAGTHNKHTAPGRAITHNCMRSPGFPKWPTSFRCDPFHPPAQSMAVTEQTRDVADAAATQAALPTPRMVEADVALPGTTVVARSQSPGEVSKQTL